MHKTSSAHSASSRCDFFRHDSVRLTKPTFAFRPHGFVPADTKARLTLRMSDSASDAYPELTSRRCTDLFFMRGREATSNRNRLALEAHFVRFNNQLRSLHIRSLVIDARTQEITLDWRQVCQDFLHDEFICRYHLKSLGSWAIRPLSE
jgi:hypothetical protein